MIALLKFIGIGVVALLVPVTTIAVFQFGFGAEKHVAFFFAGIFQTIACLELWDLAFDRPVD